MKLLQEIVNKLLTQQAKIDTLEKIIMEQDERIEKLEEFVKEVKDL